MSRKVTLMVVAALALVLIANTSGSWFRQVSIATSIYPVREQTITSDTSDFRALTTQKCTDKTLNHRYQELYARAFHHVRSTNTPIRLLEVGLGCVHLSCAAGGAKAFMSYLPQGKYHSLELNVATCKEKYNTSDVDAALEEYIDNHLCAGSSVDPDVIVDCSARFGPFDAVIDDASHMHKHTTSAFRQWFASPYLNPGGMYIVEDMQAVSQRQYDIHVEGPPDSSHPTTRGATFMNYAQNIFFCKLAGMFCFTPRGGLTRHSMAVFVPHVSEIVMARESTILRKRAAAGALASPIFASQDIIVALSTVEHAVYAQKAHVLFLGHSSASDSFLQSKFPHGYTDVEATLHADRTLNRCISSDVNVASCVKTLLSSMESTGTGVDLLWIELSATEHKATWRQQSRIIEVITALIPSKCFKAHGVVAISGYQTRRAAFEANQVRPASEPQSQSALSEPILRFLLDLSTTMLCCRPTGSIMYKAEERDRVPHRAKFGQVEKLRVFVGDISIDDSGRVYVRKMHPDNL